MSTDIPPPPTLDEYGLTVEGRREIRKVAIRSAAECMSGYDGTPRRRQEITIAAAADFEQFILTGDK